MGRESHELFEFSFEPTLQRHLARADTEMFMRPFTFHVGTPLSIAILKQLHAASLQPLGSFRWYTDHSDSWDECEYEGAARFSKIQQDLLDSFGLETQKGQFPSAP